MLAQEMFVMAAVCNINDNNMVKIIAMTSCKTMDTCFQLYSQHL